MGSTIWRRTGHADIASVDHVLQWDARTLSGSRNIIAFKGFGIYLIVLPVFGVMASAQAELISGN